MAMTAEGHTPVAIGCLDTENRLETVFVQQNSHPVKGWDFANVFRWVSPVYSYFSRFSEEQHFRGRSSKSRSTSKGAVRASRCNGAQMRWLHD